MPEHIIGIKRNPNIGSNPALNPPTIAAAITRSIIVTAIKNPIILYPYVFKK